MKIGDLVMWSQGFCDVPGVVIDIAPAKSLRSSDAAFNPKGLAVLAMLPELDNDPEWFHECELERLSSWETVCENG